MTTTVEKTVAKWTEDRVTTLVGIVGNNTTVQISKELVEQACEALNTTTRSVSAKLRKMGYTVASLGKQTESRFSPEDAAELRKLLERNPKHYTFQALSEAFKGGKFSRKEIQGKVLSMDLTGLVKPTEQPEVARTYTDEEQTKFVTMAKNNCFLEDIAEALGKSVSSVRGKALSLLREKLIDTIPTQKNHKIPDTDGVTKLDVPSLTVAEIAENLGKSERGVKVMLTRRKLTAKDYDGAAKAAKAAAKQQDAA